jgi:trimeric autotransporter adhesin
MPAGSDLIPFSQRIGREMPRSGWPILRAAWAALAVLCMSGCGATPGVPALRLSAASLSFGHQPRGTTSSAQSLTATNTGSAPLSITQLQLTGAYPDSFIETNTCGTSLAAGASCTISVQFAPNGVGSFAAAVTLNDNAPDSPQFVALSGTGTGSPQVSFSNTSLAFGSQLGGSTSSAQNLTVTNTGNATLNITQIGLTGSYPNCFRENNSCGSSLAVGSSCTISVQFAPNGVGSFAAAVSLTDNAPNSPQLVPISGTGTNSSGSGNSTLGVSFSPSSVSFGNQPVEVASSPDTITLANNSGTALNISSLAFTGADPADFTENNTCGSSVAAVGTCTIVTVFTPSASGSRSASLSVTDNVTGSPQAVALSGAGTHDVILTWSASAGAAGYDIYRGSSSGGESSTPLNTEPIAGTSYTDTSVQAGRTYYYKITAVAANGSTQSGSSSEVSATVPSP